MIFPQPWHLWAIFLCLQNRYLAVSQEMEAHQMLMSAGEKVGRAGVYRVVHKGHRPSHQSILQEGEIFPACRICGTGVRFDFAQKLAESDEVEHIGYDRDFMDSVLGTHRSVS